MGSRAVATCTSIGDPADISSISWINATGEVLVNETAGEILMNKTVGEVLISAQFQTLLELVFDPVTDDQSLEGAELTCRVVTVDGEVATQTFQVTLLRECKHSKCFLHESGFCSNYYCTATSP